MTVTPFYDLVNIALYPEFEQDLAMAIGDEFQSPAIHAYQLADFADNCQLPRALVARTLKILGQRLLQALTDLPTRYANNQVEQDYLQRYQQWTTDRCHYLLAQVDDIQTMIL